MSDEWLSIEEMASEINELGFTVNNLFQYKDYWQCNLASKDQIFTEFVRASTIRDAMLSALKDARKRR